MVVAGYILALVLGEGGLEGYQVDIMAMEDWVESEAKETEVN